MKDRPRWKYGKPFGEGTWREGNKSGDHILLRVYRSEQRLGWPAKEFASLITQKRKSFKVERDMIHASYPTVCKALKFGARAVRRSLGFHSNFPHKDFIRRIRMESNNQNCSLRGGKEDSRGALVVLEGLDRCGKTTQSTRLVKNLERVGYSAELWRFPDRTTSVGKMISSYLSNESQLDDHTIHLLFSANRWEKRSLMESKLKSGTTLVVDRYSYSGVAFSSAKGLDIEWCKAPEIGLLAPDLVVYLDIPPEVCSHFHLHTEF
ncbi:hypothetical protein TB2_022904 [Malus domestica]